MTSCTRPTAPTMTMTMPTPSRAWPSPSRRRTGRTAKTIPISPPTTAIWRGSTTSRGDTADHAPDRRKSAVEGAITRYRVLANVVGVFLLLLCVGVIVKYGPPRQEAIVSVVGPIHGFLYMVYLVTAFDLYRRTRWPLGRMVTMV